MTTPTPTWGENSGAIPTPPQQFPAEQVPTPSWGSPSTDPASPSSGLGLQPQAGELSFMPPGYEAPSYAQPAPPAVAPMPMPSPAPAPYAGYPTNDAYAGAGYPEPAHAAEPVPYGGYPAQEQYAQMTGPVPYVGVPGQAPQSAYAQPAPYQEPYSQYHDPYQQAPAYGLSPFPMMTAVGPLPTGLAVASMVIGIVSFFVGWCGWLIPLPLTGLVLGIVALQKANRGQAGGKGMAITGIILSSLAALASVLAIIAYIAQAASR